ncbi:MAG TPA: hypothetical protein GX010_01830 [Erysipelotrichaceae bacterium]|nr:hypothetical protein [Erysipelotrichaceae bacterium]
MNKLKKYLLLLTIPPLLLSSCGKTDFNACLETSNSLELMENYCYQVSREDVVDSFYLISKPIDSSDGEQSTQYDIEWNTQQNISYFMVAGGLEGKKITTIFRSNKNSLRINLTHFVRDKKATFGYIKVNPLAFTIKNSKVRNISIYVYVAIGEQSMMVEKPSTAYAD